jgi:hypothetical protein
MEDMEDIRKQFRRENNWQAAVRFFDENGWEGYAKAGHEQAQEIEKLFSECKSLYSTFRVRLREPYFGLVDRLQQGDPHYMAPGLIWWVEDASRRTLFAGAYDFGSEPWKMPIFPVLRSFLLAARGVLRRARAGEIVPLAIGSEIESYKTLPDYIHS